MLFLLSACAFFGCLNPLLQYPMMSPEPVHESWSKPALINYRRRSRAVCCPFDIKSLFLFAGSFRAMARNN
jgi:hypothetical protein